MTFERKAAPGRSTPRREARLLDREFRLGIALGLADEVGRAFEGSGGDGGRQIEKTFGTVTANDELENEFLGGWVASEGAMEALDFMRRQPVESLLLRVESGRGAPHR